MKVTIINLTYGQYDTLKLGLKPSIEKIEYPEVEWLVWDNGSQDPRIIKLLSDLSPDLIVDHPENIGVAKAKNQLFLRATGDLIMSIDPDILYPDRWVTRLVEHVETIRTTGLAGYYPRCGPGRSEKTTLDGLDVQMRPYGEGVYGGYMFHRGLLDSVGYLYEGYGLYGHTARDFAIRVWKAGLVCYYIGKSQHLGHPSREGEYRDWKKGERSKYTAIRQQRYRQLLDGEIPLYVPPPERMELWRQ